MKTGLKVAVVGATGAVGRELLGLLETKGFPVGELIPFASPRSEGKTLSWKGKSHRIRKLQAGCFDGVQIAFFDASDAISRDWVMPAAEAGAWVIDNSSVYRLDKDIPLLVPEVNGELLTDKIKNQNAQKSARSFTVRERIISGPNCVAAPLVMALKPIRDRWGIERVVVSTYQSTSGAGASALDELSAQTVGMFNQKPVAPRIFPHQIAFNCLPHIGSFKEDGYTGEEEKVMTETRKILNLPDLRMTVTAVRVPTFTCHAESVNVECLKDFSIEEVRAAMEAQDGVVLLDDPKRNIYPLGLTSDGDVVKSATGKDPVFVGRIRKDASLKSGLNLWLVSDNLRKGAALNAVQIAQLLLAGLEDFKEYRV